MNCRQPKHGVEESVKTVMAIVGVVLVSAGFAQATELATHRETYEESLEGIAASHALGQFVYEFPRTITEFRSTLAVTSQGDIGNVIFKVETEEGVVYTSDPITPKKPGDVHLRFKPTKKLVLITDPNGSDQRDHSIWLHPAVR